MALQFLFRLFGRSASALLFRSYATLGKLEALGEGMSALDRIETYLERKREAKRMAQRFVKMVEMAMRSNIYGFPEKSPFTRMVQGSAGKAPLRNTGGLIDHLKVEERATGYSIGWDHKVVRSSPGKRKRLTAYKLVQILEKGARIPVAKGTVKGEKVRKFFKAHGVYLKNTKSVIVIPPRPFYTRTISKFKATHSGIRGVQIRQIGYRVMISVNPRSGTAFSPRGRRGRRR